MINDILDNLIVAGFILNLVYWLGYLAVCFPLPIESIYDLPLKF